MMRGMAEERDKPTAWTTAIGVMHAVWRYVVIAALIVACYALFQMRTHSWPYFGPGSH